MKKTTLSILLVLALLFCACACKEPSAPPEPTPAPTEAPYAFSVSDSEPAGSGYEIAVSLYDPGTNDFDGERQWTVIFDGLSPRTVDRRDNPARFDGDYSVWTTYDRDGDWDNCTLGRCIDGETEWKLLDAMLFSRDYREDPDVSVYFQTPRFIVRKGDQCRTSTSVWNEVGKAYYIDDDVCTYWINPDGSVIRTDADGAIFRSAEPLTADETAYLYLLYEAYYITPALQYPCAAHPEEMRGYRLLIERNGVRTELPSESFEPFIKLVSVEADQSIETYAPCFACTTEVFANADYPAPEVLRFRFAAEGYDPDQSPHLWFSLREDGRIVRETPLSAGFIHTVARWRCFGVNRVVSDAAFPVEDILSFLAPYGIE